MMKEKAQDKILDRDLYKTWVRLEYKDALELLQEVINYGTILLLRCLASSEKKLKDIVAIGVFFKHVLCMLDTIEIMLSHCASIGASLPLRSLFEDIIQVKYMMLKDFEYRANAYYVWNIRQQRMWAGRAMLGDMKGEEIKEILKKEGNITNIPITNISEEELRKIVTTLTAILGKPKFKDIDARYEEDYKKKKYDQAWYKMTGINSLKKIAREVGFEAGYLLEYSMLSGIAHGTFMVNQVRQSERDFTIEPIRQIDNIKRICSSSISLSLELYMQFIDYYRKSERPDFDAKYLQEWKSRHKKLYEKQTKPNK